jgi:hypothetical protein
LKDEDIRFEAHYGLKSDMTPGPKRADIHHAMAQDQQPTSVCSSDEDNPKSLQAVNVLRQRKPPDNECSIAI